MGLHAQARTTVADVLVAPRVGALAFKEGGGLSGAKGDVLVCGVWEKEGGKKGDDGEDAVYEIGGEVGELDESLGGVLGEAVVDASFSGKAGSSTEVVRVSGSKVKRVVLYGLGVKGGEKEENAVADLAAFAVGKGAAIKSCESVAVWFDGGLTDAMVAKIAEGAHVAAFTDERYKMKKGVEAKKIPTEMVVYGGELAQAAVARGVAFAAGVVTTKEVVASPANYLTPKNMGDAARQIAKEEGLECEVLGTAECEKLGMGSYLGVAQGASSEPQFIHMVYKPEGGATKKVAIVGKSVCHDTGGYNLKAGPGSMIELMKWDMGGGGTTLGAARAIGQIKPPGVEVHFIMPAVMNMISADAYLPGDIITASNGKTIEVLNTDAEGRLCLCDALVYAEKTVGGMDAIVDIATLTGACIVALGNGLAGMWSPSDKMADSLVTAAKGTPDKMWRMPLPDEYNEQLKSKLADLRNIGTGRAGGSITAALFLQNFVETKEWAHLDIAGTAWSDKNGCASGWGVRTLTKWVEGFSGTK